LFVDLLRGCRKLLLQPCCGVCHGALSDAADPSAPCEACCRRLALLPGGLAGILGRPVRLPWLSAGIYAGPLRQLLLRQRRHPDRSLMRSLLAGMRRRLHEHPAPLDLAGPRQGLVLQAIPSWKRRANPLPELMAEALTLPTAQLLARSRPTLGQHHLPRELRRRNQAGSFRCTDAARSGAGPGRKGSAAVLLVDDILTTGSTAMAAAQTLREQGFHVAGLLCLGRTPRPGASAEGPAPQP
jgi:predicted amidophosphoribosyltransferase